MKNLLGISFQLYPLPVDNNVPSECGVKFLLFIKMIIFQYFAVLLLPMSAGHNFLFIARAKKNIYEFQIRFTRISKFFFKYSKYFKNIKNLKLRAFGIHFSWISCQKKNFSIFQVYWLCRASSDLTWICHLAGQRYRVSHREFERLGSGEEQWLIFIQYLVGGFNCKEKENWNSIKNLFKSNFLKLLQNKKRGAKKFSIQEEGKKWYNFKLKSKLRNSIKKFSEHIFRNLHYCSLL